MYVATCYSIPQTRTKRCPNNEEQSNWTGDNECIGEGYDKERQSRKKNIKINGKKLKTHNKQQEQISEARIFIRCQTFVWPNCEKHSLHTVAYIHTYYNYGIDLLMRNWVHLQYFYIFLCVYVCISTNMFFCSSTSSAFRLTLPASCGMWHAAYAWNVWRLQSALLAFVWSCFSAPHLRFEWCALHLYI